MIAGDVLVLRDATPSDRAFLLALYASTRADEFAQFGWPPEAERAFMQLQFEAQRGDYERRHPAARCRIVELRDCPVGRLWTAREGDRIVWVLDVSVVTEMRGQGIATECLLRRAAPGRGRTSWPVGPAGGRRQPRAAAVASGWASARWAPPRCARP